MVSVNVEKCIGCGACVALCPAVFEMGSDGKSKVKDGADTGAPCTEQAKNSCPTQAISL